MDGLQNACAFGKSAKQEILNGSTHGHADFQQGWGMAQITLLRA
ncbi:hypothetical protein AB4Y42_38795 [Paraburkholderia sp. EG286B]